MPNTVSNQQLTNATLELNHANEKMIRQPKPVKLLTLLAWQLKCLTINFKNFLGLYKYSVDFIELVLNPRLDNKSQKCFVYLR